ncbi:MAG: hypothetical protein EOM31_09175 [Bacteroidia bacterium]|nr:hypothetical protein [Bacteroidia bacterium]
MTYKLIKTGLATLMLASMVACSEKNDYLFGAKEPFVESVASTENDGIFTPDAQKGYALIRSNAPWQVKSLADWVTCTTTKGEFNDTIYFDLSVNTGNIRKAQLVVYNTIGLEKTDTLTITQQCDERFIPKDLTIDIQSKDLEQKVNGEVYSELQFQVTSNTPWRVFTKATDKWSTVLTKKGEATGTGSFLVTRNADITPRDMYLYVQSVIYPSLKDSILIQQDARPVELKVVTPSTHKILLDEQEALFTFSVKCDGKWIIENIPNWLTIEKTEYDGHSFVTAKASAATGLRQAQLRLKSLIQPDKTDVLNIEQNIIPSGRMKDSLALVALYQATGGERWLYNWKLELPLSDSNWPGVFFDTINGELRVIDLSLLSFNLEGSLPNEIGWLTEVVKIKVQKNKLSGPLPNSINRLTNLTHLYLSSNQFTGEFPDIPALQKLMWIECDFCRFEGEFPASFSMLPKLTTLKMKYNNFDPNSCVPKRFGGWRLIYINPQRTVYGDAKSDYKLQDCAN